MPSHLPHALLLAAALCASACSREYAELCDPQANDVSFEALGSAVSLEGRWVSFKFPSDDAPESPGELVFDAEGFPTHFRTSEWQASMNEAHELVFGCDALAYPLQIGASNTFDRLETISDWDRKTLLDSKVSEDQIELEYWLERGPADQRFEWRSRIVLTRVDGTHIDFDLSVQLEPMGEWQTSIARRMRRLQ